MVAPRSFYADGTSITSFTEQRRRVLLVGSYLGFPNFGDILQLKGAIRFHRQHTGLEPTVLLSTDAITGPDFVEHVRAAFAIEEVVFWSPDRADFSDVGLSLFTDDLPIGHAHIYGGGFFNRYWGAGMAEQAREALTRFAITSCVVSGQQVDPQFADDLVALLEDLPIVLVGCRDALSVDLLRSRGVAAEYSFDDASEQVHALAPRLVHDDGIEVEHPTVLVHMNASAYTAESDVDEVSLFAGMLDDVVTTVGAGVKAIVLQAYTDQRVHEVVDTLGVISQLEHHFPFPSYGVIHLDHLAMMSDVDHVGPVDIGVAPSRSLAISSSYHVAMLCAAMGVPCWLRARNDYYEQKNDTLSLPKVDLQTFLHDPHPIDLRRQLAARLDWCATVVAVYSKLDIVPTRAAHRADGGTDTSDSPAPVGKRKTSGHTAMKQLAEMVGELQTVVAWHAEQHANWRRETEHRDEVIADLKRWIDHLEADVSRLPTTLSEAGTGPDEPPAR